MISLNLFEICFHVFSCADTSSIFLQFNSKFLKWRRFPVQPQNWKKKKQKENAENNERYIHACMIQSMRWCVQYYTRVLYVEDELTHVENDARAWCVSSNMTIRSYERRDVRHNARAAVA